MMGLSDAIEINGMTGEISKAFIPTVAEQVELNSLLNSASHARREALEKGLDRVFTAMALLEKEKPWAALQILDNAVASFRAARVEVDS